VRHQPKSRAKSATSSTSDPWVSSSDCRDEEEVNHPIGQDKTNAVARGRQRKAQVIKVSFPL
jgi:hypothetical protein